MDWTTMQNPLNLPFRPTPLAPCSQYGQHNAAPATSPAASTFALPMRGVRPVVQPPPAVGDLQAAEHCDSLFMPQAVTVMITTSGRMLNADGSRPETLCHVAAHLRNQPHHHKLRCGHEVVTAQTKACGSNCETIFGASTLPGGLVFSCPDDFCKRKAAREARQTKDPFIPKKTAKPKLTWRCVLLSVRGTDAEAAKERDAEVKMAKLPVAVKRQIGVLKFDNPGPATLAEFIGSTRGTKRNRSRSPEREGSDKYRDLRHRDATPQKRTTFTRELQPLQPDYIVEKEVPHSHVQPSSMGGAPVRTEHDHIGDFSITEEALYIIRQAQGGVEMPVKEEDADGEMAEVDYFDYATIYVDLADAPQTYCVCHSTASDTLVECTTCKQHYHPVCVGKGKQNSRLYSGASEYRTRKQDVEFYQTLETFRCHRCDQAQAATLTTPHVWKGKKAEAARMKKEFQKTSVPRKATESSKFCGVCSMVCLHTAYFCSDCYGKFVLCHRCAKDPSRSGQHRH
nr:hypothetical protein B0A51_05066 [Rachicladosporium sp. CCFEE 5018]